MTSPAAILRDLAIGLAAMVDRAMDCWGDEEEGSDLAERGRRLASERDDLIAAGIDPARLAVPIHPDAIHLIDPKEKP